MKRKLHTLTYYQCDWTGYVMAESNCYLPTWSVEGRLVKKGHYCNWESVLAHARVLYKDSVEELHNVENYLREKVGEDVIVPDALQDLKLNHLRPGDASAYTARAMHVLCCYDDQIAKSLVMISVCGTPYEMKKDVDLEKLSRFQPPSKGDFEYWVYFDAQSTEGKNKLASSIFKLVINGPAYVVKVSKESCFMQRQRMLPLTYTEFEEKFIAKKKRKKEMSSDEYSEVKAEMAASLDAVEASVSASAQPPQELAQASKVPPPDGKELAQIAPPPAKRKGLASLRAGVA